MFSEFKVLPKYFEELDDSDTNPNSEYFLGHERLANIPRAVDYFDKVNFDEKQIFLDYMNQAKVICEFLSSMPDPINPKYAIRTSTHSDGVYIWEGLHIHFLEYYNLDLPKEFKEHILSFNGNYSHLEMLSARDLKKVITEKQAKFIDVIYIDEPIKKIEPYLEISSKHKTNLPSVFESMYQLTEKEAEYIYNYLINGIDTGCGANITQDIINPKNKIDNKILVDDTYAWNLLIPYLVKNYRVGLPKEFLFHIKQQKIIANNRPKDQQERILLRYKKSL